MESPFPAPPAVVFQNPQTFGSSSSTTNFTIGIALLAFVATVSFFAALKCYAIYHNRRFGIRRGEPLGNHAIQRKNPRGLTEEAKQAIPVFEFHKPPPEPQDPAGLSEKPLQHEHNNEAEMDDELQCAVCLAEFEDGEAVKELPGCKHWFHADCVDEWLTIRDTCPICRTSMRPPRVPPPQVASNGTLAAGEAQTPVDSASAPHADDFVGVDLDGTEAESSSTGASEPLPTSSPAPPSSPLSSAAVPRQRSVRFSLASLPDTSDLADDELLALMRQARATPGRSNRASGGAARSANGASPLLLAGWRVASLGRRDFE